MYVVVQNGVYGMALSHSGQQTPVKCAGTYGSTFWHVTCA